MVLSVDDSITLEYDFTLVHSSLRDPVWDYLLSPSLAEVNFRRQDTPYCLVGHSHMPIAFKDVEGPIEGLVLNDGMVFELDGSTGSVVGTDVRSFDNGDSSDIHTDTYDGTHPNARGEHLMAGAFARAMREAWAVGGAYPAQTRRS